MFMCDCLPLIAYRIMRKGLIIMNFDRVDESNYTVWDELALCEHLMRFYRDGGVSFKQANRLYREFNSAFDQWLIPELGLFRLFCGDVISLECLMRQLGVLCLGRKRLSPSS